MDASSRPYVISRINLIIDDISYKVGNVFNGHVQESFFSLGMKDMIDIKGLGILQVRTISIVYDTEKMKSFPEQEFRRYNIRCQITDKVGAF